MLPIATLYFEEITDVLKPLASKSGIFFIILILLMLSPKSYLFRQNHYCLLSGFKVLHPGISNVVFNCINPYFVKKLFYPNLSIYRFPEQRTKVKNNYMLRSCYTISQFSAQHTAMGQPT